MNKKSNNNCFMLYARALSITWVDTEKYWRWVSLEESNGAMMEVAELEKVCWLEVHGRLDTRKLSPGILYEVSFHVMLKHTAQGWEVPINMRLVLPGGKIKQEHKENLKDKMRGSWMDIPVGQFIASDHGEIEFSMYEYDGGIWKSGLLIKGVSIKPNSDDYKLMKQPSLSFTQSLQDILKNADSPIDKSSEHKIYDQLYSGIFLHHKTQACKSFFLLISIPELNKYWMNKKSNSNCFMFYARALSISWADNEKYWRWVSLEESNGTMIEVAELERVCWLEVHGRLDTRKLSPGILYEVSFHVMLKDRTQGWEVPINMRLFLPGGKIKQEHKENLKDKVRGRWMEIPVGQFIASNHGEIEFSMYEYDGGIWKSGLLIKGVSIKPNFDNYKLAL
ncbi:protein PHLOEM PROTEIN 2-LIKE A1-like [Senna tora]|uniref:Protein PHLOEM PROTEIN 2-LIKE A1-like n=1 Tax=Senna tora TaxID=362788 RepID=A0A834XBQ6_9FABA|nr:protein PHLOEM PROTEIN 2-LIKE A1-like [Senna tora]